MTPPNDNIPQQAGRGNSPRENTQCNTCSKRGVDRRGFLGAAAAGSAAVAAGWIPRWATAGPFEPADTADHFVPADKKLRPEWIARLFAKGESTWYAGDDLNKIAMPIGGVCTGQLYLAGDGRLIHWDIFNGHNFSGYGATNYQAMPKPEAQLQQGFAIEVTAGGKTLRRSLDRKGFPGVRFCGEYPLGGVEYVDEAFPVTVRMEAFSPFIPLNEEDSALPVTVLELTVENRSDHPVQAVLAGWLENAVCCRSGQVLSGMRQNRLLRAAGRMMIHATAKATEPSQPERPVIVLADFEGGNYGQWTVEGEAFGTAPATGTLPRQQEVSGFQGKGLVNTYLGGDDRLQGKLISPEFLIERRFISFLLGGGNHAGKTCINLVVDGQVVRTACGKNREQLQWHNWNVAGLAGKKARIEIVDQESRPWGHINVDQIELRDKPRQGPSGPLDQQPDFGSMGLAILHSGPEVLASTQLPEGAPAEVVFQPGVLAPADRTTAAEGPIDKRLCGALGRRLALAPGERQKVTFLVTWHFPHLHERGERRGRYYAVRFPTAAAVAGYVAENFDRLAGQTRLWHATWYDSTLPHWLLDRLFSTVSTLATNTCQWWENGRFWAYEGVCCCHGTCSHVWNYEHAMARLFPRLERSVRQMQDFDPQAGFVEETGMVRFRGEGWNRWAGDGQAGTILKAYREHQMSADDTFLRHNWPRVRKALEFLIHEDADDNGILEGAQHNTYDIDFYGPNTMVGSLYLAALRAGEEMAQLTGDEQFARRCRKLYEAGRRYTENELFNGEYFIQKVDLAKHPKHQYADGCLADQLFGEGWARQVHLGSIYSPALVRSALKAIWVYCWAPDVGPQNKAHPPQRWFARPGQAGLFTCTWPKSKHLGPESVLYRDEVWTGIEYQVAGHMAWEGMLTEALAICRGIHERYHPRSHNPWNEVECGDHYARALASYGVLIGLAGFEYDGPGGHLGFAPRITPEQFRCAFTAAKGWGTLEQIRSQSKQTNTIGLRWGELALRSLAFRVPGQRRVVSVQVSVAGRRVEASTQFEAAEKSAAGCGRVVLKLAQPVTIREGETLTVEMTLEA